MSNRPTNDNPWKALFLVTVIGVDFAVCVLLGFFAGKWLAERLDAGAVWMVVGLFAGIIAGVGTIYALVRPFLREERNE